MIDVIVTVDYFWLFVAPNQMRGRERRFDYDDRYDRKPRRRSSSRRRSVTFCRTLRLLPAFLY